MKNINFLKSAIFTTLIALLIERFPTILDHIFINTEAKYIEDDNKFEIDIKKLNPETMYYISLGRPRGYCNILLDKNIPIFIGKSSLPDIRTSLLVGAGFTKKNHQSITVDCREKVDGFKTRLSFKPQIYQYHIGLATHLVRAISEMFLGPLSSLLLFLTCLVLLKNNTNTTITVGTKSLLYFSIISILYSFSLAYYSRLFFNGEISSYLHIYLRIFYSLAFTFLLPTSMRFKHGSFLLHILAVSFITYTWISKIQIEISYLYILPIFSITTITAILSSAKISNNFSSNILFPISLSWFLAQVLDFSKQFFNMGAFTAPIFISIISTYLVFQILKDYNLRIKYDEIKDRILNSINSDSTAENILSHIAYILSDKLGLDRTTCYLDEYTNGNSDRAGFSFKLTYTSNFGDAKFTDQNNTVKCENSFCLSMINAITKKEILCSKGISDKIQYYIIPVGSFACINLTSTKILSNYDSNKNLEILKSVFPAIQNLETKISDAANHYHHSLSKLKSKLPPGIHEREIGAIFIDIYNYSKFCENNGDDYAKFISSTYFPTLMKFMANFATPEVVRGDEIYFVVTKDLSTVDGSIYDQTHMALKQLDTFIHTIGTELCKNHGFPVQEFRIGASIGTGNIVIDDVMVRTSGDHINRAKRLQDSALKGEILMEGASFDLLPKAQVISISRKTIVVKKNVVEAVRMGFKNAA